MTCLEVVAYGEAAMLSIPDAFDLNNAVGKQLDITGEIVGLDRLLNFQPQDGRSAYLDDDTYRLLQKAKISQNHWDGTIPGMYELWENLFPDYGIRVKDNQNMTMTVYILGNTDAFIRELAANGYIIPRPEGVMVNYEFTYGTEYNLPVYLGIHLEAQLHYYISNAIAQAVTAQERSLASQAFAGHKEYLVTGTA